VPTSYLSPFGLHSFLLNFAGKVVFHHFSPPLEAYGLENLPTRATFQIVSYLVQQTFFSDAPFGLCGFRPNFHFFRPPIFCLRLSFLPSREGPRAYGPGTFSTAILTKFWPMNMPVPAVQASRPAIPYPPNSATHTRTYFGKYRLYRLAGKTGSARSKHGKVVNAKVVNVMATPAVLRTSLPLQTSKPICRCCAPEVLASLGDVFRVFSPPLEAYGLENLDSRVGFSDARTFGFYSLLLWDAPFRRYRHRSNSVFPFFCLPLSFRPSRANARNDACFLFAKDNPG
jgi:hypothetical protein